MTKWLLIKLALKCLLLLALHTSPLNAAMIRSELAFACQSLAALRIFESFIERGDWSAYHNALRNGECLVLHHGQEVRVLGPAGGDIFHTTVELPGDARVWHVTALALQSAIEMQRFKEMLLLLQEALAEEARQRQPTDDR